MSKEAKAFLDGMAAMWAWTRKGGLKISVMRATWENYAAEICEDSQERVELERFAAERFPN